MGKEGDCKTEQNQVGFFLWEMAEKVELFQEIRYYLMNGLNPAWKIDKFESGL